MATTGQPARIRDDGRPEYEALCDVCGKVCAVWVPLRPDPSPEKIADMVGRTPQRCNDHPLDEPPPPAVAVPDTISPAQLLIAARRLFNISRDNLNAAVEAVITEIALVDQATAEDARDKWTRATVIERTHPLILVVARGFGLTQPDIDQLFIIGATL